MATPDPLIPLPVRLPTSTVLRLRAQADAKGCSVSDVLRAHLTLADAKPLGNKRPEKRPEILGAVGRADPALLRAIASIGNNINQISRSINSRLPFDPAFESLATLQSIDQQLKVITADHLKALEATEAARAAEAVPAAPPIIVR